MGFKKQQGMWCVGAEQRGWRENADGRREAVDGQILLGVEGHSGDFRKLLED